jgi:hypothetical protein
LILLDLHLLQLPPRFGSYTKRNHFIHVDEVGQLEGPIYVRRVFFGESFSFQVFSVLRSRLPSRRRIRRRC